MIILTMTYEKRPAGGGSIERHFERFFYDDDVKAQIIQDKISEFLAQHKTDYSCRFEEIERI